MRITSQHILAISYSHSPDYLGDERTSYTSCLARASAPLDKVTRIAPGNAPPTVQESLYFTK
jgi:hypothetical protein